MNEPYFALVQSTLYSECKSLIKNMRKTISAFWFIYIFIDFIFDIFVLLLLLSSISIYHTIIYLKKRKEKYITRVYQKTLAATLDKINNAAVTI